MSAFLVNDRPTQTIMLRGSNPDALFKYLEEAQKCEADAYGFSISGLCPEFKNSDFFSRLFKALNGKPVYVTNYSRCNTEKQITDEQLKEQLLCALDCGASLIDVPGHMFSDAKEEISYDERAAEKQRSFIEEIHRRGGEVLMSSHIFRFVPQDEVMKIANAHRTRGADISKIVTMSDNEEESLENLRTTAELKLRLGIPSLFLSNGACCAKHRLLSPALGSCMCLCSPDTVPKNFQPHIGAYKTLFETISGCSNNILNNDTQYCERSL